MAFPAQERVTCAVLRFAEEAPIRWEQVDTYGVDAGVGCFIDESALPAYFDSHGQDSVLDALGEEGNFGLFRAPTMPSEMALFSTGFGDGAYASYWGFGASGERVALATDFDILSEPAFDDRVFPDFQRHPEGPLVSERPKIRLIANEGHPSFEVEGEDADDIGFVLQDAEGRPIAPHAGERHEVTEPAGERQAASDDDRVTLGQAIVDPGAPAGSHAARVWYSANFVESLPRPDTEHLYILWQLSGVLSRP